MKIHNKGWVWSILSLLTLIGFLTLNAGNAMAASPAWDTRPCHASPSNDNCTEKLPVAPLDVPANTAINGGSGECLNGATQSLAQPITETTQISDGQTQTRTIATLTIWWLQDCGSYAANVSVPQPSLSTINGDALYAYPTVKVTMTSHDVDTSQDTAPLDNFFGIQQSFSRDQSTGPVASYTTWTPMIWSPGSVTSVCTSITFESGISFSPYCVAASVNNGKLIQHQMIDAWVHV